MTMWLMMLFFTLLTPAVMILIGRHYSKRPPDTINHIVGYRTAMSMINQETWQFAHKLIGNIWFIGGLILLPISIGVMGTLFAQSEDSVALGGTVLSLIQVGILLLSIFPVEIALRYTFDKDGNRK